MKSKEENILEIFMNKKTLLLLGILVVLVGLFYFGKDKHSEVKIKLFNFDAAQLGKIELLDRKSVV